MLPKIPIVVIGGSGAARLLEGLRSYPVELTALISTADSGGSTGRLRDELGIIPVGDLRKCVLALGEFSPEERALWNYRFTQGSLKGHALGNIVLAGLIKQSKNLEQALQRINKIWKLAGHKIIPISQEPATLCAQYSDGAIVRGEHLIDEPEQPQGEIIKIWLESRHDRYYTCHVRRLVAGAENHDRYNTYHACHAQPYNKNAPPLHPAAMKAIRKAKLIIFAPGDFYTNTIIPLLAKGGREVFCRAKAPLVFVTPFMTSRGETDNFTLSRLVATLEKYLAPKKIDIILANTEPIPSPILKRYRAYGEKPIALDWEKLPKDKKIVAAPTLSHEKKVKVKGDALRRSMISDDPQKLARQVLYLLWPRRLRSKRKV
jgi:2-phospho-L-lactate transferase/gluconeogenesis factor (CofD/UPF0052 family)